MIREAMFWKSSGDGQVSCRLCPHECVIQDGAYGTCGVRRNVSGELVPETYGQVVARGVDPIEKKPFYHFMPATASYSVALPGCNLRCAFCQNWRISQDLGPDKRQRRSDHIAPEEIVDAALASSCDSISFTYTEPTVFFEYAYDTARLAHEKGLKNTFVTNGYIGAPAVEEITPYLDAANIDLKFFRDSTYQEICGGSLAPVQRTIKQMYDNGIWVEVTTLLIPEVNDSEQELTEISTFLAGISKDIPWHISGYHPDHRYFNSPATPAEKIKKALLVGRKSGLRYVYPGNIPIGADTLCPACGAKLMTRSFFNARLMDEFRDGRCVPCGLEIAGRW